MTTLRERIEGFGPERSRDANAALHLADAAYALGGGLSTLFGEPLPPEPTERAELRDRALVLLHGWLPVLEGNVLRLLRERVESRRMPIDLGPRLSEIASARRRKRAAAIKASASPPIAHAELYALIERDPDDLATYRMLADALIDAGDPRGELIALDLANAEAAATAHRDEHADALIGPLADLFDDEHGWMTRFTWRNGYIRSAKLALYDDADPSGTGRLAEALNLLLSHPSGRLLVELSFGISGASGMRADLSDVIAMLAKRAPATLRSVHLGDFEYPRETEISAFVVGDVAPLWSRTQLRTLIIQGRSFELGTIDAPALEHLEIRTASLTAEHARAIATAHMPGIRHLEVWAGARMYNATATLDDLAPLLARTDLRSLAHLGVRNAELTDELCGALPASVVLASVRTLDLSMGCMSDLGARALAEGATELARVERIDVSDNYLTDAGIAALEVFGERVVTDNQKPDDGPNRYVTVGE